MITNLGTVPTLGTLKAQLSSTKQFSEFTKNSTDMVLWSYPPTPRQLGVTVCFFVTGASLLAAGIHLSYANVGPQQARAKARSDFVKQRLRKLLDD